MVSNWVRRHSVLSPKTDSLSRTPIVNTIADAYSYIRFLKIRPWYDWVSFNHRIARYEKKRRE